MPCSQHSEASYDSSPLPVRRRTLPPGSISATLFPDSFSPSPVGRRQAAAHAPSAGPQHHGAHAQAVSVPAQALPRSQHSNVSPPAAALCLHRATPGHLKTSSTLGVPSSSAPSPSDTSKSPTTAAVVHKVSRLARKRPAPDAAGRCTAVPENQSIARAIATTALPSCAARADGAQVAPQQAAATLRSLRQGACACAQPACAPAAAGHLPEACDTIGIGAHRAPQQPQASVLHHSAKQLPQTEREQAPVRSSAASDGTKHISAQQSVAGAAPPVHAASAANLSPPASVSFQQPTASPQVHPARCTAQAPSHNRQLPDKAPCATSDPSSSRMSQTARTAAAVGWPAPMPSCAPASAQANSSAANTVPGEPDNKSMQAEDSAGPAHALTAHPAERGPAFRATAAADAAAREVHSLLAEPARAAQAQAPVGCQAPEHLGAFAAPAAGPGQAAGHSGNAADNLQRDCAVPAQPADVEEPAMPVAAMGAAAQRGCLQQLAVLYDAGADLRTGSDNHAERGSGTPSAHAEDKHALREPQGRSGHAADAALQQFALQDQPADVEKLALPLEAMGAAEVATRVRSVRLTPALALRATEAELAQAGFAADATTLLLDVAAAGVQNRNALSASERFLRDAPTAAVKSRNMPAGVAFTSTGHHKAHDSCGSGRAASVAKTTQAEIRPAAAQEHLQPAVLQGGTAGKPAQPTLVRLSCAFHHAVHI